MLFNRALQPVIAPLALVYYEAWKYTRWRRDQPTV